MIRFSYFHIFLLIALFSVSCKEEKVDFTLVQTGEVLRVDSSTVIFTARIINITDPITEYGFKWDLERYVKEDPHTYSVSTIGSPVGDYFEEELSTSMDYLRYYLVRAFVKTSKGISYGRYVTFQSLGSESPQILSVKPDTVTWNDTIIITGKNFGYNKIDAKVTSGSWSLPIIKFTKDTILVKVPSNFSVASSNLKLTVMNQVCQSETKINLAPPKIISFVPDTAAYNTSVVIKGKYFLPYYTSLRINGQVCEISNLTSTTITFRFPSRIPIGYNNISVVVFGQIGSSNKLYNPGPIIKSFEPSTGVNWSTVIVKGKFFNNGATGVSLGDYQALIESINDSIIKFVVPNNAPLGPYDLKVFVYGYTAIATQKFTIVASKKSPIDQAPETHIKANL
jgi:hypothetical protein